MDNRGGCEHGDGLRRNILDAILQPKCNSLNNSNESLLMTSCAKLNSSNLSGSKKSLRFGSESKDFYKSHGQRWLRAIRRGEVALVREMLEEKPELVHYTPLHGVSSMHLAAGRADRSIILLLLSKGGEIDVRDAAGYTCLQKSILGNNVSLAHFLISQGANMDLRDPDDLKIDAYNQWTEEDDESARQMSNTNNLRVKNQTSPRNDDISPKNAGRHLKTRPASTPDTIVTTSEPGEPLKRGKSRGSWRSFFMDAKK